MHIHRRHPPRNQTEAPRREEPPTLLEATPASTGSKGSGDYVGYFEPDAESAWKASWDHLRSKRIELEILEDSYQPGDFRKMARRGGLGPEPQTPTASPQVLPATLQTSANSGLQWIALEERPIPLPPILIGDLEPWVTEEEQVEVLERNPLERRRPRRNTESTEDGEAAENPENPLARGEIGRTSLFVPRVGRSGSAGELIIDADFDQLFGEDAFERLHAFTGVNLELARDFDGWVTSRTESEPTERVRRTWEDISDTEEGEVEVVERVTTVRTERIPQIQRTDFSTREVQTISGPDLQESPFRDGLDALQQISSVLLGPEAVADGILDVEDLIELHHQLGLRIRADGDTFSFMEAGIQAIDLRRGAVLRSPSFASLSTTFRMAVDFDFFDPSRADDVFREPRNQGGES